MAGLFCGLIHRHIGYSCSGSMAHECHLNSSTHQLYILIGHTANIGRANEQIPTSIKRESPILRSDAQEEQTRSEKSDRKNEGIGHGE